MLVSAQNIMLNFLSSGWSLSLLLYVCTESGKHCEVAKERRRQGLLCLIYFKSAVELLLVSHLGDTE